jgi:hypothetical protein
MVDMSPLASALLSYAIELNLAAAGSGLAYIKALRDKALAMIANGNGQTFISSTVNGQTFTASVDITASSMFEATQSVVDELIGSAPPDMTYPQWTSGFPH